MPEIKGYQIDSDLLVKLIEEGIITEYRDTETGTRFFALTPTARRVIFGLPESTGLMNNEKEVFEK